MPEDKQMILPRDKWPDISTLEDKLVRARCRLMSKEPWYGHMGMQMNWAPSDFKWVEEQSRTMGVRIVGNGRIECVWYPGFVAGQSLEQLYVTIQHEIEHLVRCHCLRIGIHRDPEAWNIAADMTINGKKSSPKIGYKDDSAGGKLILPLDGNIVYIPEDWSDNDTAENFYDKIVKEVQRKPCMQCGGTGVCGQDQDQDQDEGSGEGGGGEEGGGEEGGGGGSKPCPKCSKPGTYSVGQFGGRQIDDHSTWKQSTVSPEEARQMIKDMTDQATAKCQGNAPGHLTDALKALAKPIVRWKEMLKRYMGQHVGSQRKTWSRLNRRNPVFGNKGISHHAAATVNVVVDTSGSVSKAELEQFFGEIDSIASRAKVYILQWDHAFQGFAKYKRNDWKKLTINGRGGTDMAAPIEWLTENRKIADCQILLTDGECNWADNPGWFPHHGMINVITSDRSYVSPPKFGDTVYISRPQAG